MKNTSIHDNGLVGYVVFWVNVKHWHLLYNNCLNNSLTQTVRKAVYQREMIHYCVSLLGRGLRETVVGIQCPFAAVIWFCAGMMGRQHHQDQMRQTLLFLLLQSPQVPPPLLLPAHHSYRRQQTHTSHTSCVHSRCFPIGPKPIQMELLHLYWGYEY